METSQLQSAKTQLAAVLGELEEKRTNPFRGTALEALAEEIRALRKTYRLSYRQIAAQLAALKIATDEEEVGEFCRFLLKSRTKKDGRRRRADAKV
jgi:uncharacterized protein (DUF2336 family)